MLDSVSEVPSVLLPIHEFLVPITLGLAILEISLIDHFLIGIGHRSFSVEGRVGNVSIVNTSIWVDDQPLLAVSFSLLESSLEEVSVFSQ
jgi:hypothetical protein